MYADCLPGARVTVSVAGEEALEYETENEPFRAVSFIEAIPGANFAVILDIERDFAYRNPQDCIKFKISLDGQGVKSNIISTHRQNVFQFRVDGVSVKTGNVTMLKVFQFAEHASSMYRSRDHIVLADISEQPKPLLPSPLSRSFPMSVRSRSSCSGAVRWVKARLRLSFVSKVLVKMRFPKRRSRDALSQVILGEILFKPDMSLLKLTR
jgi:hypothetical protein